MAKYKDPTFYKIVRPIAKLIFKILYRPTIIGKENIPKDNNYIVCSNHLSTLDPFLVCFLLNRPVAYMAKKEFWI